MSEKSKRKVTPYTRNEKKRRKSIEVSNAQEKMVPDSRSNCTSPKVYNDEKTIKDNVQGSDSKEPKAFTGLKRKSPTTVLTEPKRKKSTEGQVLKERSLDPKESREQIKNLTLQVNDLKSECMRKDIQVEKLKAELVEKAEEIKKLVATNNRYKSGKY